MKKDEDQPGGFVEVTKGLNSSSRELELIYPNWVKLQMNDADLGSIKKSLQKEVEKLAKAEKVTAKVFRRKHTSQVPDRI